MDDVEQHAERPPPTAYVVVVVVVVPRPARRDAVGRRRRPVSRRVGHPRPYVRVDQPLAAPNVARMYRMFSRLRRGRRSKFDGQRAEQEICVQATARLRSGSGPHDDRARRLRAGRRARERARTAVGGPRHFFTRTAKPAAAAAAAAAASGVCARRRCAPPCPSAGGGSCSLLVLGERGASLGNLISVSVAPDSSSVDSHRARRRSGGAGVQVSAPEEKLPQLRRRRAQSDSKTNGGRARARSYADGM